MIKCKYKNILDKGRLKYVKNKKNKFFTPLTVICSNIIIFPFLTIIRFEALYWFKTFRFFKVINYSDQSLHYNFLAQKHLHQAKHSYIDQYKIFKK